MKNGTRGVTVRQWCLVAGATGVVAVSARAQCRYEVTTFVPPGCPVIGPPPAGGNAVNEHGAVVGNYSQCFGSNREAFQWTATTGFVTLPRAGFAGAIANDVNGRGEIVGFVEVIDSGIRYAAAWRGGEPINLGTTADGTSSEACAINRHGHIVGHSFNSVTGHQHGALWRDDEITSLGPTIGAYYSAARDINDLGQVVGWRAQTSPRGHRADLPGSGPRVAFLWHDGVVTDLGVLPDGTTSEAKAINNRGQVVGYSQRLIDGEELFRGFLWSEGVMTELSPLPGHRKSGANDINDAGLVIGSSYDPPPTRTVIWIDGVPLPLDELVDEKFLRVGAGGINTSGQIAGGVLRVGAALLTPRSDRFADLDCDLDVDLADLLLLLRAWGTCGVCPADLDEDGQVGSGDLFVLLGTWGE